MAHEITFTNGTAEMAYVGDLPWHGLGQSLEAGASIETWRAAAGMNWDIESSPVTFAGVNGPQAWNDQVVLYRSDTSAPLGVVSDTYQKVQPAEVLEFFRDLTDAAGFQLETAGTLFGGKRFWALASIGAEAAIADPRDKVKGYLLLSSSADGSLSTEGRYTHVRVVCNNTLSAARSKDKASVKVTHRSVFDPKNVKRCLGIEQAHTGFELAMTEFRRMAETVVNPTDALLRTARLFTPKFDDMEPAEKVKLIEKPTSPVRRIGELMLNKQAMGSEFSGSGSTAWGWLNAVTQYIDHEGRSRTADRRLESAWYGPGNAVKEQARQVAMEMVDAAGQVRTVYQTVSVPAPAAQPVSVSLDDVLNMSPACV